jgi:hypothetical protein
VLFPGALGDFVCFLPTLHTLRARYAGERLTVVMPAPLLPLAVRPGLADEGIAIERAAVARLFVVGGDISLSFEQHPSVRDVFSWFATGDPIVRENLGRLADGQVVCATFHMPDGYGWHVTRYFLESSRLGEVSANATTHLPLRTGELAQARDFWRRHDLNGRTVLAMHRGAGSQVKRWNDAGFADVASWWRRGGGAVLEIAGPADPQEPLLPGHVIARGMEIGDIAGVLARTTLFIGADSGISHLAGAVGARGVVLFGPTRPRSWRPLGGRLVCLTVRGDGMSGGRVSLDAVSAARVVRTLSIVQAGAASP